jgi:hypothetical protein
LNKTENKCFDNIIYLNEAENKCFDNVIYLNEAENNINKALSKCFIYIIKLFLGFKIKNCAANDS